MGSVSRVLAQLHSHIANRLRQTGRTSGAHHCINGLHYTVLRLSPHLTIHTTLRPQIHTARLPCLVSYIRCDDGRVLVPPTV